jgi:hypothetical protein
MTDEQALQKAKARLSLCCYKGETLNNKGLAMAYNNEAEWLSRTVYLSERTKKAQKPVVARPLEEWHEDLGEVLWWKFPIDEAPYCGSPLCSDWPGYHTHFTMLDIPKPPKGAENDG